MPHQSIGGGLVGSGPLSSSYFSTGLALHAQGTRTQGTPEEGWHVPPRTSALAGLGQAAHATASSTSSWSQAGAGGASASGGWSVVQVEGASEGHGSRGTGSKHGMPGSDQNASGMGLRSGS